MGCNRSKPNPPKLPPARFEGVAFENTSHRLIRKTITGRHRERSEAIRDYHKLRSVCGKLLERSTYIARDVRPRGAGDSDFDARGDVERRTRGEPA